MWTENIKLYENREKKTGICHVGQFICCASHISTRSYHNRTSTADQSDWTFWPTSRLAISQWNGIASHKSGFIFPFPVFQPFFILFQTRTVNEEIWLLIRISRISKPHCSTISIDFTGSFDYGWLDCPKAPSLLFPAILWLFSGHSHQQPAFHYHKWCTKTNTICIGMERMCVVMHNTGPIAKRKIFTIWIITTK